MTNTLNTKYIDLTDEQLKIEIAKELGYQVRRNKDHISDFWEASADGERWWGQDRLAHSEKSAWKRLASILPNWIETENYESTHLSAAHDLQLPSDLDDKLTDAIVSGAKSRPKITYNRIKAEWWLMWKRGELK